MGTVVGVAERLVSLGKPTSTAPVNSGEQGQRKARRNLSAGLNTKLTVPVSKERSNNYRVIIKVKVLKFPGCLYLSG